MAIVINGSGTVTGISVGGLPDGIVDAGTLATNSVDSAELIDGSIDNSHLADNAVGLAEMASGTDGNIISYDASGNPVAIATGSDGQVLTSTGAGSPPAFEAASGGDNTPAFSGIGTGGDHDFADSAYVKMLFEGTEEFDSDGAFASSRFTVPSGEGGKYFVSCAFTGTSDYTNELRMISKFYVNGSPDNHTYNKQRAAKDGTDNITINHATILTLSAADYVEVYVYKDPNAAGVARDQSRFCGFKLLGV